jgi:hypothetical protein
LDITDLIVITQGIEALGAITDLIGVIAAMAAMTDGGVPSHAEDMAIIVMTTAMIAVGIAVGMIIVIGTEVVIVFVTEIRPAIEIEIETEAETVIALVAPM